MTHTAVPIHKIDAMLKEADAADLLCQSVRTLQKWRVNGAGPQFYKLGRSVRYCRADLLMWIAERRQLHTADISNR